MSLNQLRAVTCTVTKDLLNPVFKWIVLLNSAAYLGVDRHREGEDYLLLKTATHEALSSQLNLSGAFDLANKTLVCLVEHPILAGEPYFTTAPLELKRNF